MHLSYHSQNACASLLLAFLLKAMAHVKHKPLDPYYAPTPLYHFMKSHQGLTFSCCTRRLNDSIHDFTDFAAWTATALSSPAMLMKSGSNLDGACLSFMQTTPSSLSTEEGVDFHYMGIKAPLFFGNTAGLNHASLVDESVTGEHNAYIGTSYM